MLKNDSRTKFTRTQPEPCLEPGAKRCSSVIACDVWGYCKERHIDAGKLKPETCAKFRAEANARRAAEFEKDAAKCR